MAKRIAVLFFAVVVTVAAVMTVQGYVEGQNAAERLTLVATEIRLGWIAQTEYDVLYEGIVKELSHIGAVTLALWNTPLGWMLMALVTIGIIAIPIAMMVAISATIGIYRLLMRRV